MDEFAYEDYEYYPEYYQGITGACIKWKRNLKKETIKRVYKESPVIMKLQNQELMQPNIWEFKMED